MRPISEVYNEDCMIGMARYPDKFFELAIVDPPYGIGKKLINGGENKSWAKLHRFTEVVDWDILPTKEYFTELFRISKNQIIWGGNYFDLPPCRLPICWDKVRPNQKNSSEWEYAWTSFEGRARLFKYCNNGGFIRSYSKIHPTQKPVALYKWLLHNYAHPGDKILDTHLGSQSSRIAAYDGGFDFYGWELDPDYFRDGCKRFDNHIKQLTLSL